MRSSGAQSWEPGGSYSPPPYSIHWVNMGPGAVHPEALAVTQDTQLGLQFVTRQEPSIDFQNAYIWTVNIHLFLKECEQNKETLLSTENVA
ncbi:hypothetical protein E5288_WYG006942 [Bos mutus]|uniref:Uncharacterized protein n=1 Tax=Bos mutus TaxID=72004 RepID=A0A6B0QSE3_9CETA|nr:hypothetical protein [Bos mutus]